MPSLSKHDLAKVVAALAVALLTACSRSGPGSEQSLIAALSQELKFQYHDCIPLGWQPVAVAGTYYPGFSAAAPSYEEFSDAIWRGSISFKDLRKPGPRTVFTALNHLVSAGLLERNKVPAGYDYLLRPQALQYYFGSSLYGNNHDLLKYLCYSTIVPQRILWSQRLPYPRGWRKTNAQW